MKTPVCLTAHCRHTVFTLALAVLLASQSAQAAVKTWTGTTDGNWATGGNWGTTAPASGDSLVFTTATGLGGLALNDNLMTPGGFNVAGITFNAGAGSYVISPATAGTNGLTLTGNVTNTSASLQTLNDLITTTAVRTFTMATGGDLTFGGVVGGAAGGITTAGAGTLTLGATANSYTGATTIGTGTTLALTGSLTGGTAITANVGSTFTGTGVLAGATSLTANFATVTLAGANTFSGVTTVTGSTLNLDYNAQNNSKLADAAALTLAGTTVNLLGGTHVEVVGSTVLNAGASVIARSSGTSSLRLNAITRNAGATLNLGSFADADTNNSNGILGGYATFSATAGTADWAKTVASGAADTAISAFTAYDTFVVTANDTKNPLLTGTSALTGNLTTNSLKINSSGTGQALTLGSGRTLSLISGGLMFTGANDYQISSGTLKSTTSTNSDLVIQQWGTGTLTINSVIANGNGASTLTKAGPGTLILTGANTYTGLTFFNEGTLKLASGAVLGSATLTVNGTLDLNNASQTVDALNGKTSGLILNNGNAAATLTIGQAGGSGSFAGVLADNTNAGGGTLGLTKVGSGTETLTGASAYSGATTVNIGTLSLIGAATLANTTAVAVNSGTLVVGDSIASTNKINPAAGLALGGIFTLTQPATGTTAQTFASLTLVPGVSTINNSNGAGALSFTGTGGGAGFVRNPGGFINSLAVNFTNAPTAAGGSSVTNSSVAAANDILIGVIASTTDFAKAAAGALSATTAYAVNTLGSGLNTNITASSSLSGDTQSLRFGTLGGQALTLGGATTIESGGILQTVTGTSFLVGGSIQPLSGKNLWLYGLSGKDLNISSNLVDNGTSGLEKYGSNTVNLFGTNTFAGQIWLGGGGFVGVNNTAALGAGTANINFVGSTTLSANVAGISSARNIVVYTGQTATIATNGNDVTLSGVISNNVATTAFSTFTKTGLGKLTLSGISNFTSPVGLSLTGGELEITGAFTTQGNLGNNSAAAGITFTVSGNGIMSNTAVGGSTGDWNFGGTAGTLGAPTYITLNLTGNGQMTVGTRFFLGKANYVTAVANQSGTSTMTLPLMGLNSDSNIGTNNIYNLNGGTLNTSTGVNIGAGGVLNFNGGTFRAYGNNTINAASASSIGGTAVKSGGAIFNTNGFTTTVAPAVPLTHDSTLGATADGGVTKNGAGTLILGGFSTYTGTTTVNAGALNAVSAVTSTLGITTVNGNGTVSTTGTTAGLVVGQGISGTGIPANTFINGITDSTHFTVSANPTASGTVTATFAAAQGLGGGAVVLANTAGVILNISGSAPASIGSLAGGGALGGNLALLGGANLTIGGDNTSPAAYGGILSGTGSLTKTGTGTLVLSGANTYTGATAVNAGTLSVTGSLVAASAVTVGSSGTLTGTGTVPGTVSVAGTLAPGSNGANTLTTGAVTLTGSLTAQVNGGTSNKLVSTGVLTLSGATLNVSEISPATASPYVIAQGSGLSGTFAVTNLPAGYSVSYTATEVVLTKSAGFASWITGTFANGTVAGGQQGPNDDPDHDGVSNLVEYAIAGLDPTVNNVTPGTFSSNTLSFSKRPDTTGLTYAIEVSTDLGLTNAWAEAPAGPTYVNNGTTISYTLPGGPAKEFMRLKVTQAP